MRRKGLITTSVRIASDTWLVFVEQDFIEREESEGNDYLRVKTDDSGIHLRSLMLTKSNGKT